MTGRSFLTSGLCPSLSSLVTYVVQKAVFHDTEGMAERISILGVPVDAVTHQQVLTLLRQMASSGSHHVMTPNPEMIVAAQRYPEVMSLLHRTALNVPDGAGLVWAAKGALPERVTGTDLVESIAAEPALQPVFFLGGAEGVAARASEALRARHPELVIAGSFGGSPKKEEEDAIVRRINASGAKALLVAYGAPAQDLWIDRALPRLPSVHIAMGVGGAFDFHAGVRSRAPKFLQRIGLEWLWRVLQEPSRIGRICTAVLIFPFLVLTSRSRS